MKLEEHHQIPGVRIAYLDVHRDERGVFREIFREDLLEVHFVQGNHSTSVAGVLRGLHYHRKQADAWYVISGTAQAIVADLRSPESRPAVDAIDLDGSEPKVLFIPPGVAHGFLAVTDLDLIYWVTELYDASDEFGIAWDDPTLNVPWKRRDPILSERDQSNPNLEWTSIAVS